MLLGFVFLVNSFWMHLAVKTNSEIFQDFFPNNNNYGLEIQERIVILTHLNRCCDSTYPIFIKRRQHSDTFVIRKCIQRLNKALRMIAGQKGFALSRFKNNSIIVTTV